MLRLDFEYYSELSEMGLKEHTRKVQKEFDKLKETIHYESYSKTGSSERDLNRFEELKNFLNRYSNPKEVVLNEYQLKLFKLINSFSKDKEFIFNLEGYGDIESQRILKDVSMTLGINSQEVENNINDNYKHLGPTLEELPNLSIGEPLSQEEVDINEIEYQLTKLKRKMSLKPMEFRIDDEDIKTNDMNMERIYEHLERALNMERNYIEKLLKLKIGDSILKI